jgi:hypothetical protein
MLDLDARDMGSLKLTVDRNGVVWELVGSRLPRTTGMDVAVFLKQYRFDADYNVRVVSTPINAAFIIDLYEHRLKRSFQSLEVCSPLCCLDPADRDDPEVMLYSMRKFRRPPSLGGWHEFETRDLPSYLLSCYFVDVEKAMDFRESRRYPTNYAHDIMYHHPVWPYLSFIEGLNVELAAELVAGILDPRWYTDPLSDSNDGDRLEQFLGLYPGVTKEIATTRSKRYQLVLGCWKNSNGAMLKADGPRGFIWRVWASKGGGEKGDIAACKCFVNYLRLTWIMSLCSGSQSRHLFVPLYFFSNRDEIEAFAEHIGKVNPAP